MEMSLFQVNFKKHWFYTADLFCGLYFCLLSSTGMKPYAFANSKHP